MGRHSAPKRPSRAVPMLGGGAAALQYVRKVAGSTRPSQANQEAFDRAVAAVTEATRTLLEELVTSAPPKNREVEAAKARARAEQRYAR